MDSGLFKQVYDLVKKIPKGRVTTYGRIGKTIGVDPRVVGWALHGNRDPGCPCHRVVNKEGRLAPGYAFGGPGVQKQKLLTEGVKFKDEVHVDLVICLWSP